MLKVFLDANVYFAGCFSKEGASSLLLQIAARKKIILFASKLVLKEADRNLRLKSSPESIHFFHRYIQKTKILVIPTPEEALTKPFEEIIHPKDVPILGAAIAGRVDYLLTLDKKHFIHPALQSKIKKPKIMTPADFICQVYLRGSL